MELLKIATAGSVDDGKSTLIGRLLYETGSVTSDRLEALQENARRKGLNEPDLSLLTDGLVAEREQGITIDVAHIYFSTAARKYIIADTPGHFEYTRNMVTGASNAHASLILADASRGLREQSLRHYYIACMLRIPHVIVCINKMDLVDYDETVYRSIETTLRTYAEKQAFVPSLTFIPVSSLKGENITSLSAHTPWYTGLSLLDTLERLPVGTAADDAPVRFRVQSVIRLNNEQFPDYRAFAGKLISGTLYTNDEVSVLPSGRKARVTRIEKGGAVQPRASAGESVSVVLDEDIDAGRDSLICGAGTEPAADKTIRARLCWFDSKPATEGNMYVLGHGSKRVRAKLVKLENRLNVETLENESPQGKLALNEIAEAEFRVAQELTAEPYATNRANGSFILIDEHSHQTAALGLIAT